MTNATDPTDDLPAVPDHRLSVLGELAKTKQRIVESDFCDLPVPRWQGQEPEVYVRCRPVPYHVIREGQTRVENAPKARRPAMELNALIDVLINYCEGVYGRLPDDETDYSLRPGDPYGPMTLFDPDLARNLGMDEPEKATARQVLRELFISEGDINSAGQALMQWSGYREVEAREAVKGE